MRTATQIGGAIAVACLLLMGGRAGAAADAVPTAGVFPNQVGLGDRFTVTIVNPTVAFTNAARDRSKVILYLDQVPLRGICTNAFAGVTNFIATNSIVVTNAGTVVTNSVVATNATPVFTCEFLLQRHAGNQKSWTLLLGSPRHLVKANTRVNVGVEDAAPLWPATANEPAITLVVLREGHFQVACGLFVVFGALLLTLSRKTEMLRDAGPSAMPEGGETYQPSAIRMAPFGALLAAGAAGLVFQDGRVFFVAALLSVLVWATFGFITKPAKLCPYSLARTQMAIWFFLVIGAFGFLWLVTGSTDSPNSTVLALIGIGAGTALAVEAHRSSANGGKTDEQVAQEQANRAKLEEVRANRKQAETDALALPKQRQQVEVDIAQESAKIGPLEAKIQEAKEKRLVVSIPESELRRVNLSLETKQVELARLDRLIQELPGNRDRLDREIADLWEKLKSPGSVHFLNDVLTDDKGISFHRFQMFIWTIVLGLVFIFEVYANLAMPEFSASLLALMGISSGTYLGFMIKEAQPAK